MRLVQVAEIPRGGGGGGGGLQSQVWFENFFASLFINLV